MSAVNSGFMVLILTETTSRVVAGSCPPPEMRGQPGWTAGPAETLPRRQETVVTDSDVSVQ
jgi:hypothetical protein